VTLHEGGTLTETNSTLNAASGDLGFGEGSFGLIGSEGQGTSQQAQRGQIETMFHKMAFCGTAAGLCCATSSASFRGSCSATWSFADLRISAHRSRAFQANVAAVSRQRSRRFRRT
jgi:hypothetical protein